MSDGFRIATCCFLTTQAQAKMSCLLVWHGDAAGSPDGSSSTRTKTKKEGKGRTCKVFGDARVNGARPVRHCVVLGHLCEEGGVIAMGAQQGQMARLAGLPCRYSSIHTSQVNGILCHAPVGCPFATCMYIRTSLTLLSEHVQKICESKYNILGCCGPTPLSQTPCSRNQSKTCFYWRDIQEG